MKRVAKSPCIPNSKSNDFNPSIIYLIQICDGLEISIEELVKSL